MNKTSPVACGFHSNGIFIMSVEKKNIVSGHTFYA